MKHTKLPWFVGAINDALFIINEKPHPVPVDDLTPGSATVRMIAKLGSNDPQAEEDAEFIVHACNSHYALLEALKDLVQWNESIKHIRRHPDWSEVQREVCAEIRKAEGAQ